MAVWIYISVKKSVSFAIHTSSNLVDLLIGWKARGYYILEHVAKNEKII